MARGKKKESALTSEEKLERALVPKSEQPYHVPENWLWTRQGIVSQFLNGRAYKQTELLENTSLTPVLRVGNLFTNGSWYYSDLSLDKNKYIENDDLIYAWSASFGPFIWRGGRVIYHYHIWKIQLSALLDKQFYYYWLMNDTERLKSGGHGTGMIHVTKEMMELSMVPVPPISEQQRIVDRIESLFAKLDEAKEKAQTVLDSFETRKAAILHKAFTGELTAKWRDAHSHCTLDYDGTSEHENPYSLPASWAWLRVSSAFDVTSSKRVHKEDWLPEGIPFYRTRELVKLCKQGYVDNELFISQELYDSFKASFGVPQIGDILVSGVGTIGVPYVVSNTDEFYFKDGNIIWFKNKGYYLPKFIFYLYLSDFIKKQLHDMSSGTTVDTYTIVNANRTLIPYTSKLEQTEIVRILDSLFAKEQQAKEAAEAVLEKIDLLKKSILARAFRGELGTNDPSEESAVELLKVILQN